MAAGPAKVPVPESVGEKVMKIGVSEESHIHGERAWGAQAEIPFAQIVSRIIPLAEGMQKQHE